MKKGRPNVKKDNMLFAQVDVSLVGVEHAGKTTFFKQITSMYAKEDFNALLRTDGRSQAMGRMLKITLTVLKPIANELEKDDSREAAKVLLRAVTMYSLTESSVKALKTVWADPIFYEAYRESPFFQAHDIKKDIDQCELLLDDKYVIPKILHLKLHNATHGYNSTKFSFVSKQRVMKDKDESQTQSMPPVSDIFDSSRPESSFSEVPTHAMRPRTGTLTGSLIVNSRLIRSKVVRSMSRAFSLKPEDAHMQKRTNEVRIWDIGGLFERRTDWEYFLRRSNLTLFFVSLSDYSTETDDGSGENLMQDSLNMFKVLCESEFLKDQVIQVVMTKKDIFVEKLNTMKIPLNVSGLFEDAPDGDEEFDVESNIDYIKELFLKLTETEDSFLARENVNFRVVNMFEDAKVKAFFNDCVATIRAEPPQEEHEAIKKLSHTETFLEELNKRPRGFSVSLKSVGAAIKKSLRTHNPAVNPTGVGIGKAQKRKSRKNRVSGIPTMTLRKKVSRNAKSDV